MEREGFEVIAGIDSWKQALETFKLNHVKARIFPTLIEDLEPKDFMTHMGLKKGALDVLVGGPPCQGFSKNVPASSRFLEDERNQLFRHFLNYVDVLSPKTVVMENVAEIFQAYGGAVTAEVSEIFERLGYSVNAKVLNSADFGVPQKRRRCFYVAVYGGPVPEFPEPTNHPTSSKSSQSLFDLQKPYVTAYEAIQDLPKASFKNEPLQYDSEARTDFQKWIRGRASEVTNHVIRKLSPIQEARYKALEPGQGIKDLPPELRPKGGYSGAYGRLDDKCLAPTITRWVFHPGSGRYGHPIERRGLTMREAARLQSFSDDFVFSGSFNEIAGQIGNAVPPRFMHVIAQELRKHLN